MLIETALDLLLINVFPGRLLKFKFLAISRRFVSQLHLYVYRIQLYVALELLIYKILTYIIRNVNFLMTLQNLDYSFLLLSRRKQTAIRCLFTVWPLLCLVLTSCDIKSYTPQFYHRHLLSLANAFQTKPKPCPPRQ